MSAIAKYRVFSILLRGFCAMLVLAGLLSAAVAQDVSIAKQGDGTLLVKAPAYQAQVGADGYIHSLQIGGKEWFRDDVSFSRGTYLYKGKAIDGVSNISQPEPNVVEAKGEGYDLRYEFLADGMNWKLSTTVEGDTTLYAILDPAVVTAVSDGAGDVQRTPAKNAWPTVQWIGAGKMATVKGHLRVWGPWHEMQVLHMGVAPGKDMEVTWRISDAPADVQAKIAAAPAAASPPIAAAKAATSPAPTAKGVRISETGGNYAIATPVYSATVESDGCLTQIRFGGGDWLNSKVSISRGSYFYQRGAQKLVGLANPEPNAITAANEKASVRYEFGERTLKLLAENRTGETMNFFFIFEKKVNVVRNKKGEWASVPSGKNWGGETTWYRDGYAIKTTGGSRIWGPWQDSTVWEARLKANEKRAITLEFYKPSGEEAAKAATVARVGTDKQLPAPEAKEAELVVLSPREYQVVQRRTKAAGDVLLSGRLGVGCDKVRVTMSGKAVSGPWSKTYPVDVVGKTGAFFARVGVPAGGWYTARFEAMEGDKAVAKAEVAHFGVGEVFVGAGQSNSTNCGQERTQQTSGMVAAFSGRGWQLANDPIPGCHDTSRGGSFWPAFGDAMVVKFGVPIGVAPTGHGGTSVMLWQPGGELFGWMMERIEQLGPGGFRAVLWHQGESDVARTSDAYYEALKKVILASKEGAGWEFPWFVAQVSYHPKQSHYDSTRTAQKRLWDDGVALAGPDTDALGPDYRDHEGRGIHFSPKGLKEHGRLWADKVAAYLSDIVK